MRGKAGLDFVERGGVGIIPAGAGKSLFEALAIFLREDHPRGCGEKMSARFCSAMKSGSSPRVRGKGRPVAPLVGAGGIIPAGAGKSICARLTRAAEEDHPRGCGEKDPAAREAAVELGSSPRVRGKVQRQHVAEGAVGIIPAGAGKRAGQGRDGAGEEDHPRGCGEKRAVVGAQGLMGGSSPRVRGKGGV